MTIRKALITTTYHLVPLYLEQAASSIALWIVGWITGYDHTSVIAKGEEQLSPALQARLEAVIQEHTKEHKPLSYIFGTIPFLSLDLTIRPPLLIPRSETEYWCSQLIETIKASGAPPLTILDLCCGSGCIGLALAHAFPQATVYAVDDMAYACALTRENAQKHAISSLQCIQSDLYTALPSCLEFDLIVSNPPYIGSHEWGSLDPSVTQWEDPHALIARDTGLAVIKNIIDQAPAWLSHASTPEIPQLVLECGYQQGSTVKALCEQSGFSSVEVHKDPASNDRWVTARHRRTP